MDVCTTHTVTLSIQGVHKVPPEAWGPIGKGLSALLIGRSSSTLQGLMVHVGVIDAGYHGQICAMVSTATPPVTIKGGTRIAQLIPFMSCVPATEQVIRGTQGFWSAGKPQVFWSQRITESRPEMTCTLTMANASPSQIKLIGLLDSGADMTIIAQRNWPSSWPLVVNAEGALGVGGVSNSFIAAKPVLISIPEGQKATVRPYVTTLPLNLWGRDVLDRWGVRLTTDFS